MNKLIVPDSVNVNGIDYPVYECDVVILNGSTEYMGKAEYADQHIEILSSMSEQRKIQTFYHELIHCMLFEAGFGEHDEELVDRLSKVLVNVLKYNKLYSEVAE
jgi:hypothetical protein